MISWNTTSRHVAKMKDKAVINRATTILSNRGNLVCCYKYKFNKFRVARNQFSGTWNSNLIITWLLSTINNDLFPHAQFHLIYLMQIPRLLRLSPRLLRLDCSNSTLKDWLDTQPWFYPQILQSLCLLNKCSEKNSVPFRCEYWGLLFLLEIHAQTPLYHAKRHSVMQCCVYGSHRSYYWDQDFA